ncbi:sigma-54-dependent Fis family transcriptional regulator [Prosthecochloris marina]|uniref:Sigma-54-dependent Fis family transcriptional regulator n=1 Tax=Prosthecochloris marina TaxID=2017681 RepID=A0A317TA87_9CHLB|nr:MULTISPECIES: sigma-54 dependent transcriptional regulator [Prosthecochloris]PWW82511.1 sigma-54-dependent Fis family transcriptional regulator [Prosthecochloris marina]UZJ39335.1 sigma-54 dependent transcriptional regulator [Prosthecochloris sp. SCSIO W1102]
MTATIVIIDRAVHKNHRRPDFDADDLNVFFAESPSDAEKLVTTEKPDLVLAIQNEGTTSFSPVAERILKHRPSIKIMLFANSDELAKTLLTLLDLPSNYRKMLLSGTPSPHATLQETSQPSEQFTSNYLAGNSPEIEKIKGIISKIAPTTSTILLQGETGTGKEIIARSIHDHSNRKKRVFMPVECAAINESVIESELFGHTKGSFTGADRNTLGLIRSSDGGTLFLDEIGELPLALQTKLLRTLQEKTVKPVGSSKIYPVDIRIIAATNRNLAEAVTKGTFRQDLYYRLNTVTIYAPPLRERLSDIPLLCGHFLKKMASEGYPEKTISSRALSALCRYEWPGNVRELENVIRNAVALSSENSIALEDLSISLPENTCDRQHPIIPPSSMAFHEKEAICKALDQTTGNRRAAARLLGISEATLYRRIKLYSI